ncbi:MAG: hypothetical protein GY752_10800 [bacterium]|nr:hypothetical protein [bacterium]MCP4800273.1 hypothetical protein [bacterium]
MKRNLAQVVLSVVALLIVLSAFLPDADGGLAGIAKSADSYFPIWFSIIAVFAFVLGASSLIGSHVRKIKDRENDWQYSIVTVSSFAIVLIVGLAKLGGAPGLEGDVSDPASFLGRIFSSVLSPLHATLFSLLAFYMASAAFRSFRIRSLETTVLLVSASIIIVGRLPFASKLFSFLPETLHWLRPDKLSLWMLLVPNTAGQRAVLITVSLGVIAVALKYILGMSRDMFGGQK